MLSAPPETATAIVGLDSNGPSPAISRANSAALIGLAAAVAMLFLLEAFLQTVGRPGKFLVELAERASMSGGGDILPSSPAPSARLDVSR